MSGTFKNISGTKKNGIVIATKLEGKPFVTQLGLKKISSKPLIYAKEDLYLIISGIGKVRASLATSFLIKQFQVKNILNLGAAGSTTQKYHLGDIRQIDRVIEYDLYKPKFLQPDLFLDFLNASLATQDKPVFDPLEREKLNLEADLVDMEGAAVVRATHFWRVKVFLFKIISDTPSHTDSKQIIKNMREVSADLAIFFKNHILSKLS